MVELAFAMLDKAQVGISGYRNGCALLAQRSDGLHKLFGGCNIEVSTSLIIHAERLALFKAISEGYTKPVRIVLAAMKGARPVPMCSYCRQDYMYVNPELIVEPYDENRQRIQSVRLIDTLNWPYLSKGKIT